VIGHSPGNFVPSRQGDPAVVMKRLKYEAGLDRSALESPQRRFIGMRNVPGSHKGLSAFTVLSGFVADSLMLAALCVAT
jgi:hypothetical protein